MGRANRHPTGRCHCLVGKKLEPFDTCRKPTCFQKDPSHPTRTPSLHMVYFWASLKLPQLCKQVDIPTIGIHAWFERLLTPYASYDTSSYLSTFFYRENFKKCKICRKTKQLDTVPWIGHIRPCKKLGPFQACLEIMWSQTEPSGLPWHPPLNMV